MFDLLAPDARWTIVGHSVVAGTYHSREEFLASVIRPFNAPVNGAGAGGPRPVRRRRDGDRLLRRFGDVGDGSPYNNTYTWYLRMRGGAIVDAVAFFDSIAFNELWARVEPA